MENIRTFTTERDGQINEFVEITYEDGSQTIWIKSAYDELQAKQNEGIK